MVKFALHRYSIMDKHSYQGSISQLPVVSGSYMLLSSKTSAILNGLEEFDWCNI